MKNREQNKIAFNQSQFTILFHTEPLIPQQYKAKVASRERTFK